jgi:hypothetical protein
MNFILFNAKGIYLLHCSVTLFFDNKKNLDYSDIIFIANEWSMDGVCIYIIMWSCPGNMPNYLRLDENVGFWLVDDPNSVFSNDRDIIDNQPPGLVIAILLIIMNFILFVILEILKTNWFHCHFSTS